jgi:HSP20 family protein
MRTNLTLFENPNAFLRRFTSDLERFFGEVGLTRPFPTDKPATEWMPNIDIIEKKGTLIVRADLPGLMPKDVTVEATDELLTIKGERKTDLEETKEGVYRKERIYGSFFRSIPLPEGVKPDELKATFANGVLEITMPVPTAAKAIPPRRIEVLTPPAEKAKTAA